VAIFKEFMESVGIEFGDSFYRTATLKKKGKKIELSSLTEESNVNPLDISLLKKRIVSGIEISDVLIKRSFLKLKKKRELKKALPFQMKTLTSLPLSEAIFSPKILRQEKEGFHLLYFITTKQNVKEHLEKLASLNVDPDLVSTMPMALARFAHFLFPSLSSLLLLHLEKERALCLLIENNLPTAAFSIAKEDSELSKEKKQKKQEFSPDLLEADPSLKQKIEYCCASFLKNRTDKLPLLVTGDPSQTSFIETKLLPSLSAYVSHLLFSDKEKERKFALPIGLALEGLSSSFVSFRQKELLSSKHLVFLGKRFCFFFLSSLLFLFCCAKGAEVLLEKQKLAFEKKWELFCVQEGQKNKEITFLEKTIKKESQDFPFFLKTPKASTLLVWLQLHPIFGKSENDQPLFELQNFHYELLEMPTLAEPQKLYVARVEIEFFTSQACWAHKFHQSLLEEKELIDPKEIIWEPLSEDCYKASFFLKPLTPKEIYDHKNL
jgi:hypothetical protein